jgi:peptide/nickel transport system ATP-binding protein
MSNVLLDVRDLGVTYRVRGVDLPALQEVSLTIRRGEIVGLVGESGSGKSTVASAILGILARNGQISGGSIEFEGRDLTRLAPDSLRRVRGAEITMIFQDPLGSLNPTITVGRQIMKVAASHPEKSSGSTGARRRRVLQLFEEVGIPDPADRFDYYPHQFSGGMQQRVMIAMALMLEPALIIADEATSALDVTLQAQILELFREVRRRHGTSMLLISHDLGVVAESCDQVSVMYAGRIVETADTRALFAEPRHPYTKALIEVAPSYEDRAELSRGIPGRVPGLHELQRGCAYADRCQHRHAACVEDVPSMYPIGDHFVRCYLYRGGGGTAPEPADLQQTEIRPASVQPAARSASVTKSAQEPLVVVRGLSKSFDERQGLVGRLRGQHAQPVQAVVDVDLELHRGEIVGLVGESGSGKTTLALTLLRLVSATSGQIRFDGVDVRTLGASGLRQLRRRMQIILQDPVGSLSPRLRVRTLLSEPYEINRTPTSERTPVPELLELVGLSPEVGDKYPAQLSGGQARRVSIARALALKPDLIIADEPTSGLDVSAAAGVLALMDDLRSTLGITYLVITHDLNVVGQIADRLSVMYLGRIVESGPTEQIFEDPVHPYTQGLLAAVPRIHQEDTAAEGQKVPRGEMPSPRTPPPGCRFHTRCRLRDDVCTIEVPEIDVVGPDHVVACHRWLEARSTRVPLRRRLEVTAD